MRGRQEGYYRGVQVSSPMSVAEKIRSGKIARQQLDSGEELEIIWNGNQYEVKSIDYNTITKFNTVAEINEEYDIYLWVR